MIEKAAFKVHDGVQEGLHLSGYDPLDDRNPKVANNDEPRLGENVEDATEILARKSLRSGNSMSIT